MYEIEPTVTTPDIACAETFRKAEQAARAASLGLWALAPTRPSPAVLLSLTPSLTSTGLTRTPSPTPPTQTPTPSITTIQPTQTSTQTPTMTLTATPSGTQSVQITNIFYHGVQSGETDEYVEITNNGSQSVNLQGWKLISGNSNNDFIFPSQVLAPGDSCRVYTRELHPESCGFTFLSFQPIWSNTGGDCGYLLDASGESVSTYCYQ